MAWTVGNVTGALTITAAASGNVSFGTAPNAGSTVVVLIANWDNTANDTNGVDSVTDNQGNTYTRANERLASNTFSWATIWYAVNVASSGTFTVTVTGGDPSTNWAKAVCVEARPTVGAGVTVDLNATNVGTGSPASVSAGTTAVADEYVAAVVAAAAQQNSAITGPTGYTERLEYLLGDVQPMEADDKVLTSTSTESPSWTLPDGGAWAAVVASFKEAATESANLIAARVCVGVP